MDWVTFLTKLKLLILLSNPYLKLKKYLLSLKKEFVKFIPSPNKLFSGFLLL